MHTETTLNPLLSHIYTLSKFYNMSIWDKFCAKKSLHQHKREYTRCLKSL